MYEAQIEIAKLARVPVRFSGSFGCFASRICLGNTQQLFENEVYVCT